MSAHIYWFTLPCHTQACALPDIEKLLKQNPSYKMKANNLLKSDAAQSDITKFNSNRETTRNKRSKAYDFFSFFKNWSQSYFWSFRTTGTGNIGHKQKNTELRLTFAANILMSSKTQRNPKSRRFWNPCPVRCDVKLAKHFRRQTTYQNKTLCDGMMTFDLVEAWASGKFAIIGETTNSALT